MNVDDVVDDDDVAALAGVVHGFEAAELAGAFGPGVAGEPDAGDFAIELDGPQQVGEEEDRAVHDAEEERALSTVIAGDPRAELADAGADLRLGEEDAAGKHGLRKRWNGAFDKANLRWRDTSLSTTWGQSL